MKQKKLLKVDEASAYIGVSPHTLRRWDECGKLRSMRTAGGHRRWNIDDLKRFSGEEDAPARTEINVVTYARCSSTEQKQRGDIERQSERILEYAIKKNYRIVDAIKDCGSGLNDTRKGFIKLLEIVTSGKVDKVIVENKDRLTRFGYETLVYLFRQHGVEIEITQTQPKTEYDELAQDLMMLIASFSGKLYRKRALERKNNPTKQ